MPVTIACPDPRPGCPTDPTPTTPAVRCPRLFGRAPARARTCSLAAAVVVLATGCAIGRSLPDVQEAFDSTATHSRTYAARDAQTCEAARRTLLSQGYVIETATAEQVRGRKSFQPAVETHVQIEFTVVCAKEGYEGRRTIAFVNAVNDRYAVKKSNNSASLGVGAFGSLSLPFTGSNEALVKIASATITEAPFYDRFFKLLERYLAGDPGQWIPPMPEPEPEPDPAVAGAGSARPAAAASGVGTSSAR